MAKRKRDVPLLVMVTQAEREQIEARMAEAGVRNMGAFIRKQSIDGYIIHLDLADVRQLVKLLRNATNNMNQIARRANETRSIYAADVEDLRQRYDGLWDAANKILEGLANMRR